MGKSGDPKDIANILKTLVSETALGRNLDEAKIWERWPEIAGMEFVVHGRPRGIRDGKLVIEVDSAVWMHKFAYKKAALIRKINAEIGRKIVSEIYLALSEDLESINPQDGAQGSS